MEKCSIILADKDLSYLSVIELLLLREYGNRIDLYLMTDPDYLIHFFSEPRKIDILVINTSLWQEDFRRQDIRQIFLLSEDENSLIHTEENDILLYKYTSAQDVFASINIVLRRFAGTQAQLPTQLITVYSPQGGCGKTVTALGISIGLVNIGSKVLYINAEPLQAPSIFLSEPYPMRNQLVKQILSGSVDPSELRANILHDEFDHLAPMQYTMTSYGIDETHFTMLIQTAVKSLEYDFIILDCSSEFTSAKTNLMKLSSFVVLPFHADSNGLNKYRRICECINTSDQDKFIFVRTPSDSISSFTQIESYPDFPPKLSISAVPDLQEDRGTNLYKLLAGNAFTELIFRFL